MSSFRKKSRSSTDESSSTSFTESTSSSCSSSGTDSGSSTSGSETSSLVEDKRSGQSKHDSQHKTQVITRRKSSEIKGSCKGLESEKKSNKSTTKLRSTSLAQRQSLPRRNGFSTDDDISLNKKPTRLLNTINSCQKKKSFQTSSHQHSPSSGGGGKAPPAVVKQHHQQITTKSNKNTQKEYVPLKDNVKNTLHFSSAASSDEGEALTSKRIHTKILPKNVCVNKQSPPSKIREPTTRPLAKRSYSSKMHSGLKSSDESDSDSGSTTGEGSSSSSDTDPSETSNSSVFQAVKKARTKRILAPISEDLNEINKDRKLTRSLSTRRSKFFLSQNTGGVSESDSDIDCEIAKYSFSRSSDKKVSNNVAPCKQRKDKATDQPRSQSPHFSIDKKCPIEGCDSSGHLSGNLDKHFLPEACPIFHNMSASECKERANDRIQREEMRQKTGAHQESLKKSLTAEQKDFLAKIRDSRSRFRPTITITGTEKIKIEKDCPDDDREPSLSGLVPDYDLQMFREAQAIASEKIEEELHDLPVGKGIKYITMGKYKMKVWYQSPYPDDAARLPKMYICEFCLRYQKSETGIKRHAQKCVWRHPPGDEIYRKGKLQVWQVDGKRHKQYCQHLCLLAKFFLDHKTLYYDVEPFLFYIMTLADVDGCHTVGYFSKEKNSFYNVSCILTLPPYQRKGYGRLLIDFSYLLTRVEGKIGSPEKPLSDLGLISYRSYWKDVLLDYLCNRSGSTLSIKDVSQEMAVYSYDIVSTLQALGMMKYWKGKHIVLKKQDVLDEYEERVKRRGNFPKIDDSCLRWSPFVQPQFNAPT